GRGGDRADDRGALDRARSEGPVLWPGGGTRLRRGGGAPPPRDGVLPSHALEGHVRAPRRRRHADVPRGRAGRDALEDGALDRPDGALSSRGNARGGRGGRGYSPSAMRTDVVTGGSRGTGRASALEL